MSGALTLLEARMAAIPEIPLAAGFSGGADSTALLLMLNRICRERGVPLTAVHVNHGLRGEASDGDELFARDLCAREKIPLLVYRADLKDRTDENSARKARYGFFRQAMAESGAKALVLAHHRDDQAETMLMHLFRGAGPEGLAGMRPDSVTDGIRILRPLLSIGRQELRDALTADGITWREDSSNGDTRYTRNMIRARIMPEIERCFPGAAGHICTAAGLLAGQAGYLTEEAERFIARYAGRNWILREPLLKTNEALRAVILRHWWAKSFAEGLDERALSSTQTAALTAIAENGGTVNLPDGRTARACGQCLHITGRDAPDRTEIPFTGSDITLGGVTLRVLPDAGEPGDGARTQSIPKELAEGCVLRLRHPGDRIRPFGAQGSRKLQDYLTDRRVDAPFRDRIPLLCKGNEVLLCAGIGAGNIPRYEDAGERITLLWQGEMPWTYKPEVTENGKK